MTTGMQMCGTLCATQCCQCHCGQSRRAVIYTSDKCIHNDTTHDIMTMPGWGNTHTCVRTLPCDEGKPERNASCKALGLQCRCEDSESRHHPLRSLRLTTSSGRLYEPKGTYSTLGHRSKLCYAAPIGAADGSRRTPNRLRRR